jgi:hypothetical protein
MSDVLRWKVSGRPRDYKGMWADPCEVVLAADYDALLELNGRKLRAQGKAWRAESDRLQAKIERLREWKEAIDNALVCAHIGTADSFPDARTALNALCAWCEQIALDPAVSQDARALIDKGREGAMGKPLEDYIAELEKDPAMKARLDEARKRVRGRLT